MNHKHLFFAAAFLMNAGAASAQTSVFLTQENSKSNEFRVLLVTAEGKSIIVETPVATVHKFSEGLASILTTDKKYGFIDMEGHLAIPARFSNVGYFKNGLAWAKDENGKLGFIDKSGNWAVPPQFDVVKAFDELSGLARVKKDDMWYYINAGGEALKVDSDHYWDFSEGLCQGEKNGLWGYFNNKGEWVIEPKFQDGKKFENGQAAVKVNGKWGIIDKTGNWIVEPKFDIVKEFERME